MGNCQCVAAGAGVKFEVHEPLGGKTAIANRQAVVGGLTGRRVDKEILDGLELQDRGVDRDRIVVHIGTTQLPGDIDDSAVGGCTRGLQCGGALAIGEVREVIELGDVHGRGIRQFGTP